MNDCSKASESGAPSCCFPMAQYQHPASQTGADLRAVDAGETGKRLVCAAR